MWCAMRGNQYSDEWLDKKDCCCEMDYFDALSGPNTS